MKQISLRDQVRRELTLSRRPRPLREIATEAEVGYEWLVKFAHGHIEEPGVTKLERVRDAVTRLRADPRAA